MTRTEFYSQLYDTRGLKSTRSTHVLQIWIEFYGGVIDFEQTLAFATRNDADEYLSRQFERWFGTSNPYWYSKELGIYEVPVNIDGGASADFFPEEIKSDIRAVQWRLSNTPICKY